MSQFPTTQWTLLIDVIQKGGDEEAFAAIGTLFERYRPAIRSFFEQYDPRHAEDLTQGFFQSKVVVPWNRRHGLLSPLYDRDDLRNLPGLAAKLRENNSTVDAYLREHLSEPVRRALLDARENDAQTDELREALLQDLNCLIQGPLLFEPARFAGVNLSLESRNLLARGAEGNWKVWLNRSLLGDAYRGFLLKGAGFLYVVERTEQSRFRTFLANALRWHLIDCWKERQAIKAGGNVELSSLDAWLQAGGSVADEAAEDVGRQLDYCFALHLLNLASSGIKHSRQLEDHFRGRISQKQAAEDLGMTVNAFRQAYARFRERVADSWKKEVTRLVGPNQAEVKAEMAYLAGLLAK